MAVNKEKIEAILKVGGQYAVTNRYRHPSLISFISRGRGFKKVFDLEKTAELMEKTLSFVEECGKKGHVILFVSTRQETVDLMKQAAENLSLPHMLNRWIGGTLSNFKNIRSRVEKMEKMQQEKDEGIWTKYTKKETVLLNRELAKLENRFTGVKSLTDMPHAVFVLDTRKERIAVKEANAVGVSVIGFSNADADLNLIQHPIIANIQSRDAVAYILSLVEEAYKRGVKNKGVASVSDTDNQKMKKEDFAAKSGNSGLSKEEGGSIGSEGK